MIHDVSCIYPMTLAHAASSNYWNILGCRKEFSVGYQIGPGVLHDA